MAPCRVKICGITRLDDAQAAVRLGADAIGLNFYTRSKRYVDFDRAASIASSLPPFVEVVGVFVNERVEAIRDVLRRHSWIGSVQWHGDETPLPPEGMRFVPGFPVADAQGVDRLKSYLGQCSRAGRMPKGVLVDGFARGEYGGTGNTAAWELLAAETFDVPLILAGGLTPENVAKAVRVVRPFAVDVAGGVESAPGLKDCETISRFIEQVRGADNKEQAECPQPSNDTA